MSLKCYLTLSCLTLLLLVSCGANRDKSVKTENSKAEVHSQNIYGQCSKEERVKLEQKFNSNRIFVPMRELGSLDDATFCQTLRKFKNAIDLLPISIRREFDRASALHHFHIFIAKNKVSEQTKSDKFADAPGVYNAQYGDSYAVVTSSASEETLWRIIGHFLNQYIPLDQGKSSTKLGEMDQLIQIYSAIDKNVLANINVKDENEFFAEAFSSYISSGVKDNYISEKKSEDKIDVVRPTFDFMSNLFLDIAGTVGANSSMFECFAEKFTPKEKMVTVHLRLGLFSRRNSSVVSVELNNMLEDEIVNKSTPYLTSRTFNASIINVNEDASMKVTVKDVKKDHLFSCNVFVPKMGNVDLLQ